MYQLIRYLDEPDGVGLFVARRLEAAAASYSPVTPPGTAGTADTTAVAGKLETAFKNLQSRLVAQLLKHLSPLSQLTSVPPSVINIHEGSVGAEITKTVAYHEMACW